MVQWLRLHTPNAEGTGSIPDRGTKIPHAARRGQKRLRTSTAGRMGSIPGQATKAPHATQCGQKEKKNFFLMDIK